MKILVNLIIKHISLYLYCNHQGCRLCRLCSLCSCLFVYAMMRHLLLFNFLQCHTLLCHPNLLSDYHYFHCLILIYLLFVISSSSIFLPYLSVSMTKLFVFLFHWPLCDLIMSPYSFVTTWQLHFRYLQQHQLANDLKIQWLLQHRLHFYWLVQVAHVLNLY